MTEFIEVLKYTIPGLILLAGVFGLLYYFNNKEKGEQRIDLLTSNYKILTPIRLQAYERISLLLERIHPEALIQRVNNRNLTAGQAKMLLIESVREEFDHNLSQQIYIGSSTWQTIKNAKEQIIRTINITSSEVDPKKPGILFLKSFLEKYNELQTQPIETASEIVKKEVRQYFSM